LIAHRFFCAVCLAAGVIVDSSQARSELLRRLCTVQTR
jgi:hypothetical protein